MGPIGFSLQIHTTKRKSECAPQYSGILPLDKHPTCLRLKFFEKEEEEKNVKIVYFSNQSCNFDILLDLESLIPYLPTLFTEKEKNFYWLAVIDIYFYAHTYIHTDIPKCFIMLIYCSQETYPIIRFRC